MIVSGVPKDYFSEETLSHLRPQNGLSERYQRRAIDVTLAAKLTLTYGKYHLAMLHRELAMSEERTTYQQAERMASAHPLDGRQLRRYIASMREVVEAYKKTMLEMNY